MPKHPGGWTDDCQGKKDFDAEFVTVSTRYWPGYMTVFDGARPERGLHEIPTRGPSAKSSILLDTAADEGPIVLAEEKFEGATEAEVKAKAEAWIAAQYARIAERLMGPISVNDRPPDIGQVVIVHPNDGEHITARYGLSGETPWFRPLCEGQAVGTVTHWQALPEPPR